MTVGDPNSRSKRSRVKNGVCYETPVDEVWTRVRLADGHADLPLVDFATHQDLDGYTYDDPLPTDPIPGTGERRDDCGDAILPRFCTRCASPDAVGRTCGQSTCPRCWQAWVFWRALAIGSKFESLRRDQWRKRLVWPHHLVVSFRASTRFRSADPTARAIEAAKRLLGRVDVETGVLLYHPYRIKPRHNRTHPDYDGRFEPVAWNDVLGRVKRGVGSWPTIRDRFLDDHPHFHILALSSFVPTEERVPAISDRTGVTIRRCTSPHSDGMLRSIGSIEALCRILVTELTHIGIASTPNGRQQAVYRYFGDLVPSEATPGATGTVAETLREVAPPILDVDFPPRECTKQIALSGSPLTEERSACECGGRLCLMADAPSYLSNAAWIASVLARVPDGKRRLEALRRASKGADEHARPHGSEVDA